MGEIVSVVLYANPTGAGPILKAVYKFHGDAEKFVNRQRDPSLYVIEDKLVEYE